MYRPEHHNKRSLAASMLSMLTLGSIFKGGSEKKFRIGVVVGNTSAPRHIQDSIIAAARAKRMRRASKPSPSAYAFNNVTFPTHPHA